ncbi:hypothetical protein ACFLSF_04610, partial [Candidatus Bipolaricaulota bacterium]
MRRTAACLVCTVMSVLLGGCLAYIQEGIEPGSDGAAVSAPTYEIEANAEPVGSEFFPLFVGAAWDYRNAAPDYNPEIHPMGLLSSRIVASVLCVDSTLSRAWECYVAETSDPLGAVDTAYYRYSEDGVVRFDPRLQSTPTGFPGYVFLMLPLVADTYHVYNVPKTQNTASWNQAERCWGDRTILRIGGEGSCPVGSDVAYLSLLYQPEVVGLSTVVSSLLGAYTSLFAGAIRAEFYNGIDQYPDYTWWTTEPDSAWFAPDVGIAKWAKDSVLYELLRFAEEDEIASLDLSRVGDWHYVRHHGRLLVQLRGTDPDGINPASWRLVSIEEQRSDTEALASLRQAGGRSFYNDIEITGELLDTGTYVFC